MQGWVAECKVVGRCQQTGQCRVGLLSVRLWDTVSTDRPMQGWVAECKVVGRCQQTGQCRVGLLSVRLWDAVNRQANAGLGC